ncbi:hypothetical protein CXF64_09865 [Pseudoalteromonas sp. GutCa3]|nr:hypothetical protein CXF75_12655 [Pseudoalteromonas arctica]PKG70710.1 hypothetical protein CXF64_09865 [Pseudoalteromonas sp. GutCa3]
MLGLMFIVGEVLYLAFYKVKLHEREINSHLQVWRRLLGLMFIVGEVLYLAFYKVKLHEREINSHLQVWRMGLMFICR